MILPIKQLHFRNTVGESSYLKYSPPEQYSLFPQIYYNRRLWRWKANNNILPYIKKSVGWHLPRNAAPIRNRSPGCRKAYRTINSKIINLPRGARERRELHKHLYPKASQSCTINMQNWWDQRDLYYIFFIYSWKTKLRFDIRKE